MPESDAPILGKKWLEEVPSLRGQPNEQAFELKLVSIPANAERAASARIFTGPNHALTIRATSSDFSQRSFAPNIKAVTVRGSEAQALPAARGYYPPHLDLRPFPEELDPALRRPNRVRPPRSPNSRDDRGLATGIFPPEGRRTFSDTAYPYSACGYIETAAGGGSAVMVGPRHLLTASHIINWEASGEAGALTFTPSRFDSSAPFGQAQGIKVYKFLSVNPSDGIDSNETAFDYAVCVLDWRIGDVTGWLGTRAYNASWNGPAYWAHVGYPSDMAGGFRPAFIGPEGLLSTFERNVGGRHSFGIRHKVDVIAGQSGGPFYGWWSGEKFPSVVSTQSAELWGATHDDPLGVNTCGGGDPLVELVQTALREHP